MARKRVSITTPLRYTYKVIRVHGGVPPAELLSQLGQMQHAAWEAGYGEYRNAWAEAKPVLLQERVPVAQHGLYRAFVFEYINKVKMRGILSEEELITMWERKGGLDPAIMRLIIDRLKSKEEIGETHAKASGAKPS